MERYSGEPELSYSYDKRTWTLEVTIRGERYRYFNVSPHFADRFDWLQARNVGQAMKMLRSFRYEKIEEPTKRFEILPKKLGKPEQMTLFGGSKVDPKAVVASFIKSTKYASFLKMAKFLKAGSSLEEAHHQWGKADGMTDEQIKADWLAFKKDYELWTDEQIKADWLAFTERGFKAAAKLDPKRMAVRLFTVTMGQAWEGKLKKVLSSMPEVEVLHKATSATEVTFAGNTSLTKDELWDSLHKTLNFSGSLAVKTGPEADKLLKDVTDPYPKRT